MRLMIDECRSPMSINNRHSPTLVRKYTEQRFARDVRRPTHGICRRKRRSPLIFLLPQYPNPYTCPSTCATTACRTTYVGMHIAPTAFSRRYTPHAMNFRQRLPQNSVNGPIHDSESLVSSVWLIAVSFTTGTICIFSSCAGTAIRFFPDTSTAFHTRHAFRNACSRASVKLPFLRHGETVKLMP